MVSPLFMARLDELIALGSTETEALEALRRGFVRAREAAGYEGIGLRWIAVRALVRSAPVEVGECYSAISPLGVRHG